MWHWVWFRVWPKSEPPNSNPWLRACGSYHYSEPPIKDEDKPPNKGQAESTLVYTINLSEINQIYSIIRTLTTFLRFGGSIAYVLL